MVTYLCMKYLVELKITSKGSKDRISTTKCPSIDKALLKNITNESIIETKVLLLIKSCFENVRVNQII